MSDVMMVLIVGFLMFLVFVWIGRWFLGTAHIISESRKTNELLKELIEITKNNKK